MKRNGLTYSQKKEIDLFMGTVIKKFADGVCEYLDGWSDQKVADKFGCTANNVSGLREAEYGLLRPAPPKSPLEERIKKLEDRVLLLEQNMAMPSVWGQQSLDLKAAE